MLAAEKAKIPKPVLQIRFKNCKNQYAVSQNKGAGFYSTDFPIPHIALIFCNTLLDITIYVANSLFFKNLLHGNH